MSPRELPGTYDEVIDRPLREVKGNGGVAHKANGGEKPTPQDRWPVLVSAARHGLAGDVVAVIEPHSEADPVAILLQYLSCVGNAIGHGPFYLIEGDRHYTNIYVVLTGQSSKARKGTSKGRVLQIMRLADDNWENFRIGSGISSGEGLITPVRDADGDDGGVPDKRLMIFESEFSSALVVMKREGNIVSQIIRSAWDHGNLAMMTKKPQRATGAHISIVGHITDEELRRELDRVGMANGFANRYLFACAKRSKFLPHGGYIEDEVLDQMGRYTADVIAFTREVGRVKMTDAARKLWTAKYQALSEGHPGLLGAITGRAEAQVIRLALIYALLDKAEWIDVAHLEAGLAVWNYCEASAQYIFGDMLGDPVADEILRALRQAGRAGMTRTAIRDLFARNRSANQIGAALGNLSTSGKATCRQIETASRPAPLVATTQSDNPGPFRAVDAPLVKKLTGHDVVLSRVWLELRWRNLR
jgi:Protein of unknown function (DUF3987)